MVEISDADGQDSHHLSHLSEREPCSDYPPTSPPQHEDNRQQQFLETTHLHHPTRSSDVEDNASRRPPDYLWFSILNILFCCSLLGGIALRMSRQVRKSVAKNNMQEASDKSRGALYVNIAALILGLILNPLIIWYYFFSGPK